MAYSKIVKKIHHSVAYSKCIEQKVHLRVNLTLVQKKVSPLAMVLTLALAPLKLQREVKGPRERRNIARMEVWDPRAEIIIAKKTA